MNQLPLHGITVLEFSQYLSGPSAGLRLADLGARVIKIERPGTGDAGRKLAIKDLWVDDSSLLFHTINRNKESFVADLKSPEDIEWIRKLIARSDVLIHNYRPGVMEKVGLGYDQVKKINERMIYAAISGYGKEGPWKDRPGQDLLLQSMTGLAYTSGNSDDDPTPFGIAIADILCGAQLVQGILAGLIRRQKAGMGALVELSLMESLIDFQFELFTTYHASGIAPKRSAVSNGNPLLSAPYGIYKTVDGHIAIAMSDLQKLSITLDCPALHDYGTEDAFVKRDEIKNIITSHVAVQTNHYWISRLQHAGLWAAEVMNWQQLVANKGYQIVQMEQTLSMPAGKTITTTRCPIRFDNEILRSSKPAPQLGANTACIKRQLVEGPPL